MATVAPTLMAISTIAGLGVTAYGAYQSYQASERAKDIADKNANLAVLETEEAARRLEKEQDRKMARATAVAAASGVELSGTVEAYLEDLETSQAEEVDWLRKAGYSRARSLREQGKFASESAMQQMFGSLTDMFAYGPAIYESGVKAKWWK